jgi:DNA-binding transcriptional MerR regulator
MDDAPNLSPAEVKKRLGLTTKQLRLYADKGLIRPKRKDGGWRVFGRDDLARLYQIKVLRNFGFSLEQISKLLNARGTRAESFACIVRLQADTLRQEQERVTAALGLLGNAQALLAQGKQLDLDELVRLSEFAALPAEHDINVRIRPYVARYFNERDYRALANISARNWQDLIDEAAALQARDPNPASAAARDLLKRVRALSRIYSGGDPELESKGARMFEEAMSHPDPATHPMPAKVWKFLQSIKQALDQP